MLRTLVTLAVVFSAGFLSNSTAHADHTQRHTNCFALHEAAFLDEPGEVQSLLEHGANLECHDVLGNTPLITAVNGGSLGAFKVLMSAGARVDVRTEYGQTLLQHTKEKYASFTMPNAQAFRDVYAKMVTQLQNAETVN